VVAKVSSGGRGGARPWLAKITADDVRAMRADRLEGMTVDAVFLKYHPTLKISRGHIERILSGVMWKGV
jgi:hypothetical protein